MSDPDADLEAIRRYEQALLAAEEALFDAVIYAPTETERRMLLSDYDCVIMYRHTRFSDASEWEADDPVTVSDLEGAE